MEIRFTGLTFSFRKSHWISFSSRCLSFSIILISSLPYSHGFLSDLFKEVSISTFVWGASEREDPDILETEGLKLWWDFHCLQQLKMDGTGEILNVILACYSGKHFCSRKSLKNRAYISLASFFCMKTTFFKAYFFTDKLIYISLLSQQIPVLNGKNGLQTGNIRQNNTFVLIFTWKVYHYFIFLLVILENHLWPLLRWSACHIRHYLQNQTRHIG